MSFDQAAVLALYDQLVSHAQTLGIFDRVAVHEPKNKPGNGVSCVFWGPAIRPLPSASGLAATSGVAVFQARIMVPMLQEPQDDIDRLLLVATTTLLGEYTGHFTLGGNVRNIDLLGASGQSLSTQDAYMEQDRTLYRIQTIALPIIINDLWVQSG